MGGSGPASVSLIEPAGEAGDAFVSVSSDVRAACRESAASGNDASGCSWRACNWLSISAMRRFIVSSSCKRAASSGAAVLCCPCTEAAGPELSWPMSVCAGPAAEQREMQIRREMRRPLRSNGLCRKTIPGMVSSKSGRRLDDSASQPNFPGYRWGHKRNRLKPSRSYKRRSRRNRRPAFMPYLRRADYAWRLELHR